MADPATIQGRSTYDVDLDGQHVTSDEELRLRALSQARVTSNLKTFKMHSEGDSEKLKALKTGYLIKRPSIRHHGNKLKFWAGGKRKFFVLQGSSLSYFSDHKLVGEGGGAHCREVLLTAACDVENFYDPPHATFGFCVTSPGKVLQLVAKDVLERQEWKDAISMVINQVRCTTRGYLLRRCQGSPYHATASGVPPTRQEEALWQKHYFILNGHERRLTFHEDHSHALKVQGFFVLTRDTAVEKKPSNSIMLKDGKRCITLQSADASEAARWVSAISEVITNARRLTTRPKHLRGQQEIDEHGDETLSEATFMANLHDTEEFVLHPVNAGEEVKFSGYLYTRCDVRQAGDEAEWIPNYYVLTDAALYQFMDENFVVHTSRLVITLSCSVFDTNLRPTSFELVTAGSVLHVAGGTVEASKEWVSMLKNAINNAKRDTEDLLLTEAELLQDEFYEVTFETKQPLGVVLERSKEWAIVKMSDSQLSSVTVGSALAAINGKSVVLRAYHETLAMLTGWKPPLHLVFRSVPSKEGWLKKQKPRKRTGGFKWTPQYFVLAEGVLTWYSNAVPGSKYKGAIPMMGSAVSLASVKSSNNSEGFEQCLSVVSGITAIILQGLTQQDGRDWGTCLYQASAVANGGGYLLDKERARETAFHEERERRALYLKAEAEAAERVAAAEAALLAATQAQELALQEMSMYNDDRCVSNSGEIYEQGEGEHTTNIDANEHVHTNTSSAGENADESVHIYMQEENQLTGSPVGSKRHSSEHTTHMHENNTGNSKVTGKPGGVLHRGRPSLGAEGAQKLAEEARKAAELEKEQAERAREEAKEAAVAVSELEYNREQEKAAAAEAARKIRERNLRTAIEVDQALQAIFKNEKNRRNAVPASPTALKSPSQHRHHVFGSDFGSIEGGFIMEGVTAADSKQGGGVFSSAPGRSVSIDFAKKLPFPLANDVAESGESELPQDLQVELADFKKKAGSPAKRPGTLDLPGDQDEAEDLPSPPPQHEPPVFPKSLLMSRDASESQLEVEDSDDECDSPPPRIGRNYRDTGINTPPDIYSPNNASIINSGEIFGGTPLRSRRNSQKVLDTSEMEEIEALRASVVSDEILETAFSSLDLTSGSGQIGVMQFSALWRALTSEHNMFAELKMFSKFNKEGSSAIDVDMFKQGFRNLERELGPNHSVFHNLKKWTASHSVSF